MVCNVLLDIHQTARGVICDQTQCRANWASKIASERNGRRQRNEHLARSKVSATAHSLINEQSVRRYGSFNAARIPASARSLRPADEQRQQQYRQHFEELLYQWASLPNSTKVSMRLSFKAMQQEPGLLGQACVTCRGQCCRLGNTHAFQTVETIKRWFVLNPESSIDDCREACFSFLHSHSIGNSCIFLGNKGCRLPKQMRSNMCNNWICRDLENLKSTQLSNPPPITILVAMSDEKPLRVRVVNSDSGEELEPELETDP
jgi:hypothetical protein